MVSIFSLAVAYFLLGAIIGSFLGVCAYRIPMGKYEPTRDGIKVLDRPVSITRPSRSFCPQCEKQLLWWHTIPLLSWILLKGKCGFCKAKIPFRYFLIELLTGTLSTLCFLCYGPSATGIAAFLFISVLVVIALIDIDYMIIPDVITYPVTALGVVISLVNWYAGSPGEPWLGIPFVQSPTESAFGLLVGPGALLLVRWLYRKVRKKEGLGLGDVKLLAIVGAAFGPECSFFTIFVGSVLGAITGIILLITRRHSLSTYLPFGPYLVLAALAYILDLYRVIDHLITPSAPWTWWIASHL